MLFIVGISVVRNLELGLGGYLSGILRTDRVYLELARSNNGKTSILLACFCFLIFVFSRARRRIRKG